MGLSWKEKGSYAIGAVGKDMVYSIIIGYLLYYYNDVIGISGTVIGIIFMIARVFDAFNDPIMGVVVEKTHTKFGKFRPWIFSGTVINALVLVLVFSVPKNWSAGMTIAFIAVTYILWGMTYTLMDIPFWSMLPAITKPGKERESLTVIARSCSGFGSAIPFVLTVVLVPILGKGNERTGYFMWALIIAVFFIIAETIMVSNVKEHHKLSQETPTIKQLLSALFHNDQAMIVVVSIIIFNTSLYLTQGLAIYFFEYDIGNKELFSIFAMVGSATQIVAMLLFPLLRKRWSIRTIFTGAVVTAIVGYLMMFLLSVLHITSIILLYCAAVIIFAGFGLVTVLTTIFLADTVDYQEYKTGKRNESVIFSLQTFVVKLASAFSALIAGIGIDLIGLNKDAAVQSQETLLKLRVLMNFVPIFGLIIAVVYFLKKYKLNEKKMKEISTHLEKNAKEY